MKETIFNKEPEEGILRSAAGGTGIAKSTTTSPSLAALSTRSDLAKYGDNAIGLFAIETAFDVEDIDTVASVALTDGSDDKKCDLVFVDRSTQRAVVAQNYFAADPTKQAAPANKASDLNTSVSWLLSKNLDNLPESLKAAAKELDEALEDQAITQLELWYVHNLPESKNVKDELEQARTTAVALLSRHYPNANVESVTALEVGRNTLDQFYHSTQVPILVTEAFDIPASGGFWAKGDKWEAYSTSVPIGWLHDLFKKYKSQLFSANVRGYLGSRRSDRNINHNIKQTATDAPERFWAYNNGITALVNEIKTDDNHVKIVGITIVNGAQTTGSVGSLDKPKSGHVPARFVKCSDTDVIRDIIRFNNSQNKVEATDFRSNDVVQERLRREFAELPDILYLGGRRGTESDKIKRPSNLIPTDTAAQSLAAFHQDPNLAYHEKRQIWESDAHYARLFSTHTTARHMLLCFSLLRAVEKTKQELVVIPEEKRTDQQKSQVVFFRQRGSTFLLATAIAACIEIYAGKAIPNRFDVKFKAKCDIDTAVGAWMPLIKTALGFCGQLMPVLSQSTLKNTAEVRAAIQNFSGLVQATAQANEPIFATFRGALDI
jgi:hypothetical protein